MSMTLKRLTGGRRACEGGLMDRILIFIYCLLLDGFFSLSL